MKFYFKVVYELYGGKRRCHYYESTSICAIIHNFERYGGVGGFIVEMKHIRRLPKGVEPIKAYCE